MNTILSAMLVTRSAVLSKLWAVQIYGELLLIMIENPKTIQGATYLIWTAHNLERTADRVTNIAERIVFMVTGKMEEMNVSKY